MIDTIEKNSAEPLYIQLQQLIRGWISSGRLGPGDRMPSEIELAEKYNVSRMTARHALDALVNEGLLLRRAGKGTFVTKDKLTYEPATLFSFSTAMQALGKTVSTRVLDLRVVSAPASVAKDLRLAADSQVVYLRRLRFVDDVPAAIHADYMPQRPFAGLLRHDLSVQPLTKTMEAVSGMRIVASEDYIEVTTAKAQDAKLLNVRQGAPLMLIRGVAFNSDNQPMRSTLAKYPGDIFRFHIAARNGVALQVKSA